MTDKEKAIVMAYTGKCMLTGDKFQIFHKYVEDIMGRPVWTEDIGWLEDEIREKSKADFMALCKSEDEEGQEIDFIQPKKTVGKLISSDVLDKIRAEIEQLPTNTRINWDGCCPDIKYPEIEYVDVTKAALLGIIDKYKSESEG
jgi:hypothetical protein